MIQAKLATKWAKQAMPDEVANPWIDGCRQSWQIVEKKGMNSSSGEETKNKNEVCSRAGKMEMAARGRRWYSKPFTTGSYHEPGLKVHLYQRFVIRTGTKGARAGTHLCRRLPHTFSPGSYNEPGLQGPVEPGLVLAGALPVRSGTNA